MSTAMLDPEEAAAVDLLKERDAELEELRAAVATMRAASEGLGGGVQAQAGNVGPSPQPGATLSLSGLYERYAASGAANPKTVVKWRSRVAALIAFLGHDDARRVSRADLNRWVEGLVAKGLAKKTIEAGYLPAVKVTLGLAVDDEAIASNPAAALRVRAPKPAKLRERDLTDDEATTILAAALAEQPNGLSEPHALARRWVPWLCAYTGARVGEICQLRPKDIREEQGMWVVHITPDAGSVKTHEARSVPLHPHLIEQGVLSLVERTPAAPLFYTEGAGSRVNPASSVRASDLAKWVRSLSIMAPQPNHGWRHRFKTVARSVGIAEHVADRIQGHAPRYAGGGYGFVPLATLREAIESLPRYELEGPPTSAANPRQAT
jgi:integrase